MQRHFYTAGLAAHIALAILLVSQREKKMFLKMIATGILASTLTGCASFYPLPVTEPPAKDSSGNRTVPDYQRGGLLPATFINVAIENLKIYGDSYQATADGLRKNEYLSSDIGLGGGALGVVGGLTKSVGTAITGAVFASGSSIVSQRYQFLVQAANYEKASDAMYCMYSKLYVANSVGLNVGFVNEKIDEVRRKLRKVQSSVQLASPDLSQLESSLKKTIEDGKKTADAKAEADGLIVAGGAKFLSAKAALDAAELELLKSELAKCVASF